MFCKNCGIENEDESTNCIKCGTYLRLTDSPLRGGDRVKLIGFFTIILFPFFMLFGGVIITMITLGSIYIMKKDKSFFPILKAKKYIKVYLVILALGVSVLATAIYYEENKNIYDYNQDYDSDSYSHKTHNPNVGRESALVTGSGLVLTPLIVMLFMWIFNTLYFRPMEEHQNWVIQHGIFADGPNEKSLLTSLINSTREKIQSFQKQQTCSVADELLKWKSLLDQGVITEEEFNAKKEKLLK